MEETIVLPCGARVTASPGKYRLADPPDLNTVDGHGFFLEYEYPFLLVREAAACQAYEEEKGSTIAQVEAWKVVVGYGAYGQVGYDRTGYQFSLSASQRARGYLHQLIPDISYIDVQALSHLTDEDKEKPYKPCVPAVVIQLLTPADQIEDLQAKVACFVDAGTREGIIIDTRREQVWIYNRNQRPYFAPLARIEFDSWPGFTLDCLAIRDTRLRTA